MFRTAFVAAFVAVASAASWPMITVNSAGEIVLNSPTKAGSFQLNALTVTAAPTSSGTSSRSTVTALDTDTDAFIVNVPSSPATSAGYKLPAATEGRTIRFYNSGSGKGAFTIWTSATSVFIDGTSSTTVDIASTTSYVTAVATSSTNWVISSNAVPATGAGATFTTVTAATATATMGVADAMGGIYTVTNTAAATITTPTAALLSAVSGSQNGDTYTFTLVNAATAAMGTDLSLTLAAGTGVTVPSTAGLLNVAPGQSRTYKIYRVSSSAWTVVALSQYTVPHTVIANGQALTATALTANGNGLSFTEATITLTANTLSTFTYTNAYAFYGDSCTISLGTPSVGEIGASCAILADNVVTVNAWAQGGATVLTLPQILVHKLL